MSTKFVSDNQGKHLAVLARQRGITRGVWEARRTDLTAVLDAIRNGQPINIGDWRVLEELGIEIPALKRLTLEKIREKFSLVREENGIESDTSPETTVTFELGTVLRPIEPKINGDEYNRRRVGLSGLLGLQHGLWLVEHQEEFPALMVLLGKVYIDLPGLIVVCADGNRNFPCLNDSGKRWKLGLLWAGGGLVQGGRVGRSRM